MRRIFHLALLYYQHEVGGHIQAVYPHDDPVAIICDEEGKRKGSPLNRALRDEDGHVERNQICTEAEDSHSDRSE